MTTTPGQAEPDPHLTTAQTQEALAFQENAVAFLQQRVVRLNVEVQYRDAEIADLNARLLAALGEEGPEADDDPEAETGAGAGEAPTRPTS